MAKRERPLPEITRRRLQAEQAIRNLDRVDALLWERYQSMDLAEVPALKLYCDNQWRRINKVLPDLKAITHEGQVSHHVIVKFNP